MTRPCNSVTIAALGLTILMSACDSQTDGGSVLASSPAAPTPVVTASPLPPFTLSWVCFLYESTASGLKPLAGAPLDISVEYQSWPPKTTTDAEGKIHCPVPGRKNLRLSSKRKATASLAGWRSIWRATVSWTFTWCRTRSSRSRAFRHPTQLLSLPSLGESWNLHRAA